MTTYSALIGDLLSIDKSRGDDNDTPTLPGTSGIKSLFDASNYWTARGTLTVSRYQLAGASLTTDASLCFGGYNGNAGGTVFGTTEVCSDSAATWTAKTSFSTARTQASGQNLTTDLALNFGGYNLTLGVTNVDRFSLVGNSWTARTVLGAVTAGILSMSQTSDTVLTAGGTNGTYVVMYTTVNRFSDSGNSYTARTALSNGVASSGGAGTSLTSDLCLAINGENGPTSFSTITTRFSDSNNIWISRANTVFGRTIAFNFSLTSDLALTSGGTNNSYLSDTSRFSDASNIWVNKVALPITNSYGASSSLSSSLGLATGGANGTIFTGTYRYTDKDVSARSGIAFISNTLNNTPAVPSTTDSQFVYTTTLFTSNPNTVYVSTLEDKYGTSNPATTYDISPNGGSTWSLTSQAVNTPINTSSLTVTDLRIRFGLKKDSLIVNTWTARANATTAMAWIGAAQLTSNLGLLVGGLNSPGGGFNTTGQVYNESSQSYLQTGATITGLEANGASLTTDQALTTGGYNGTAPGYTTSTLRYSYSANVWIGRTNKITAVYYNNATNMTSDFVMSCVGYGGAPTTVSERYQDSSNSWASRTNSSTAKQYAAQGSSALTTDTNLLMCGYNGSAIYNNTDRYSDSANTWTGRLGNVVAVFGSMCAAMTTDSTMQMGGNSSAGNNVVSFTNRYSDSANSFIARSLLLTPSELGAGFSQTQNTCITACGFNNTAGNNYSSSLQRYNDGETYFHGFGVR
jgi:hypothetical protein